MRWIGILSGVVVVSGAMGACGSEASSTFEDAGDGSSSGDGDPFDDGGSFADRYNFGDTQGIGDAIGGKLRVEPATVTIDATGSFAAVTGSQQFQAFANDGVTPVVASWSIDRAEVGGVGPTTGLFNAGLTGGTATVLARSGNLSGTAQITVRLKITENTAALSPGDQGKLNAGGATDANFKWLYPYDKTVFPRGLRPPVLQFAGAKADAFLLQVDSNNLSFTGYLPSDVAASRIRIPEAWWKAISQSAGGADTVRVRVTKLSGGNVAGPIEEKWSIAPGSLKGSVFYNTYNSALARAAGSSGVIMRMRPGSTSEVFIKEGLGAANTAGTNHKCVVCHSVNSNGTRLVAGLGWSDSKADTGIAPGGNPMDSGFFSISSDGSATRLASTDDGRTAPFGAVSPDGKFVVGSGITAAAQLLRGLSGATNSYLYDASTGARVASPYLDGASRALVAPAFSPDGKRIVFTDQSADGTGKKLAMLDVAASGAGLDFSNYSLLQTVATGKTAWPAFAPDSKAILYHEGDSFDSGGYRSLNQSQLVHYCANLKWVDPATKVSALLDRLNGYEPDGAGGKKCYLPRCTVADPDPHKAGTSCNTEDANTNYEPTMLPVAVGGYYWVVFTSRRSYGNILFNGPGSATPAGDTAFDNTVDGSGSVKGWRKKLWVAAIDINATSGADISHPAFYLEGQELEAGNMRGYWALNACKPNNETCETGDDCCGGFCRQVSQPDGGIAKMCVPPPSGCSQESEKCTTSAECCDPKARCLNGFCAVPTIQ